jgi:glucuronosyltransferase
MSSPQILSHILMQMSIGEELASRGHEVYLAVGSRFPKQDVITATGMKVITYHFPSEIIYPVSEQWERQTAQGIFGQSTNADYDLMLNYSKTTYWGCELMMEDREFVERVQNLQFDMAVIEPFIVAPCTVILPHYIGIPYVTFTGLLLPFHIGIPALPSMYVLPGPKDTKFPTLDTLFGRLYNTLTYFVAKTIVESTHTNTTLLRLYAPEVVHWNDLVVKSELFLLDIDHHLDDPLPVLPNVVLLGGCTLKPARPLSQTLETIFAGASDGVIVVSFGSVAYYLPSDIIAKLLDGFSRLSQTVIARLPTPHSTVIPKNVHLMSWLPQNDILGDNRTRLFITHCGLNGLYEALYHGVPFLGVPLFGEQDGNCQRARRKGFGLQINVMDFTVDELVVSIRELLDNATYQTAIKRMSIIYRDQPMTGRQKAAFWIEHVIKYGGKHLRSPAVDMPIYQLYMMDILALLLLFVLCLVFCCKWICLIEQVEI